MRRGQLLWSRSTDAIHRALGRLRTGNLQGPSLPIETSGGSRGGTQPPFFSFAPSNREREEIQGLTIIRSSKIGFFFASNIDEQTGGSSLIIIRVTVNLKRRVYEYFRALGSERSCGPCICIRPSCTSAFASRRYRAISGASGMRSTIRSHRRLSLLGCLEIVEPPSLVSWRGIVEEITLRVLTPRR